MHYFSIRRNGPKNINHKGYVLELMVLSKRHSELNKIMKPRKKEDKSKYLIAPMPGLLVSFLLKRKMLLKKDSHWQ